MQSASAGSGSSKLHDASYTLGAGVYLTALNDVDFCWVVPIWRDRDSRNRLVSVGVVCPDLVNSALVGARVR